MDVGGWDGYFRVELVGAEFVVGVGMVERDAALVSVVDVPICMRVPGEAWFGVVMGVGGCRCGVESQKKMSVPVRIYAYTQSDHTLCLEQLRSM